MREYLVLILQLLNILRRKAFNNILPQLNPSLLQLTITPNQRLHWLTVTSKLSISRELYGQIRQLYTTVATSDFTSLEDLVNNLILPASVLNSVIYPIQWCGLYSAVQKRALYYSRTKKNGAILLLKASQTISIQSLRSSMTSITLSMLYISLITNLELL